MVPQLERDSKGELIFNIPLRLLESVRMFTKEIDGQKYEVHEEVNVRQYHDVDEYSYETDYILATGRGTSNQPRAVTKNLAENLWDEFGIDVEDHDIEIV